MKPIVLKNAEMLAEFDSKTGALLRLESKKTKWRIQDRRELGLSFKMQVPIPDRNNNLIIGVEQKLDGYEVNQNEGILVFQWKQLKPQHCDALDISLQTIITIGDKGLTFNADIKNNSQYVVEAFSYPNFGDIPMPSPKEPLRRMHCHCDMQHAPLLPNFANEKGYWGCDYPIQKVSSPYAQFVLVASERQGLYVGCHDERLRHLVQYYFELMPGHEDTLRNIASAKKEIGGKPVHLVLSVTQLPYVQPGEMWSASPVVVRPYVGTWHKGVDYFREWHETWREHAPDPEWVKSVHSWQQIHINSPEDELRCRYTDLIKYGKDCKKHGVKAIQLVGWNHGGQDRGNPSHDTDPRLGTSEELRQAIADINKLGVKVVLFNKYTWADITTDWYKNELHKYVAKDPYGTPYQSHGYEYQTPAQFSQINVREFNSMCHLSKEWRDIACREFSKNLDYGADGMLYDEAFHHGMANYCFDSNHGHLVPGFIFAADEALAEGFRAISAERNPDFLFSGEALQQQQYKQYSLTYFRIHQGHIPGQRYLDPDCNIMVAIYGFNDRDKINLCLLYKYIMSYEPYNFKGRLDDFPLTMEYGKKVDALRKKYKEYLWDAGCRDVIGAKVTVAGKPHALYSVFVQPRTGKRAVAIANADPSKKIQAVLKLDGKTGKLFMASPEKPVAKILKGKITIPPRSAAVIMEDL